jgi:hypothetical protein
MMRPAMTMIATCKSSDGDEFVWVNESPSLSSSKSLPSAVARNPNA